jgi:hypothetical protein
VNSTVVYRLLLCYAAVLAAMGVAAYWYGPHRSPIALLGGIGGGGMLAVLSYLWRRRILWSRPALLSAVGIFTLSFVWRAVEAWMHANVFAGSVLTALAAISIPMFVVLTRWWNR